MPTLRSRVPAAGGSSQPDNTTKDPTAAEQPLSTPAPGAHASASPQHDSGCAAAGVPQSGNNRRGRPRKQPAASASHGTAEPMQADPPPRRGRGRPPKHATPAEACSGPELTPAQPCAAGPMQDVKRDRGRGRPAKQAASASTQSTAQPTPAANKAAATAAPPSCAARQKAGARKQTGKAASKDSAATASAALSQGSTGVGSRPRRTCTAVPGPVSASSAQPTKQVS